MNGVWTIELPSYNVGVRTSEFPTALWTYVERPSFAQFRHAETGVIIQIPWMRVVTLTFTPDVPS